MLILWSKLTLVKLKKYKQKQKESYQAKNKWHKYFWSPFSSQVAEQQICYECYFKLVGNIHTSILVNVMLLPHAGAGESSDSNILEILINSKKSLGISFQFDKYSTMLTIKRKPSGHCNISHWKQNWLNSKLWYLVHAKNFEELEAAAVSALGVRSLKLSNVVRS
jgi:hypothetical protein